MPNDTIQNWSLNAATELANREFISPLMVSEKREIIERHAEPLRIRIAALEIQLRGLVGEPARHDFHD